LRRYIKAENILCCSDCDSTSRFPAPAQWKLADFGIARVLRGGRDVATTYCGTPVYMSPEIINNKGYTHGCDVWALGRAVQVEPMKAWV
jgi:serine/threonine protein kinase